VRWKRGKSPEDLNPFFHVVPVRGPVALCVKIVAVDLELFVWVTEVPLVTIDYNIVSHVCVEG